MSANTILMIYLLRKYSIRSTLRSESAKISCPRIGIFVNPQKYHVRKNVLSYSSSFCFPFFVSFTNLISTSPPNPSQIKVRKKKDISKIEIASKKNELSKKDLIW